MIFYTIFVFDILCKLWYNNICITLFFCVMHLETFILEVHDTCASTALTQKEAHSMAYKPMSENKEVEKDLSIPTKEEISAQLKNHFGNKETDFMIRDLTESVYKEFLELKDAPYTGFAVYLPQKPCLMISTYSHAWMQFERERYPRDYSPLTIKFVGKYMLTIVHAVKRISLSYVI